MINRFFKTMERQCDNIELGGGGDIQTANYITVDDKLANLVQAFKDGDTSTYFAPLKEQCDIWLSSGNGNVNFVPKPCIISFTDSKLLLSKYDTMTYGEQYAHLYWFSGLLEGRVYYEIQIGVLTNTSATETASSNYEVADVYVSDYSFVDDNISIGTSGADTSGTITEEQLNILDNNDHKLISFYGDYLRKNRHYPSDKLIYTCLAYDDNGTFIKFITITRNTLKWELTTKKVEDGGSDTGKEIIEKGVNLNTSKFTTALTIDEFNKLKNNEAIIKTTTKYLDIIPLDLYGDNPSVINGTAVDIDYDLLVYAIPSPLIDTPGVYILSIQSNTLDSFSIKIIEVNEPVLGNSPTSTYSAISDYPLLGFPSSEADIPQLHMSNSIYIGKFTYDSTGSSYVFYEGSDSKHTYFVSKLTGIIGLENDDKNFASFEIVLKLNEKNPNSSAIIDKYYSCIIHISSITSNASEGTFTIYDTVTNKITYVILRIRANSSASPMFEMDYLKAYQDGAEITSTFVSKISAIYLNLL